MLYKFKSQVASDLIMLEVNGRQVLDIIGKDPSPQGIVLADQMPAALDALHQAVAREEAALKAAQDKARADGHTLPEPEGVQLRQRVQPFVDLLQRSHAIGQDIVWGV